MGCVWVVYGLCMGCVWVVYGLCVGYVWIVCGLCMDCVWIVYGLCVDCVWVVYGLCMGCVWIVYGLCMGCVWIVYGLCMGCVWVVYGSCINCVWVVDGLCVGYVWVVCGVLLVTYACRVTFGGFLCFAGGVLVLHIHLALESLVFEQQHFGHRLGVPEALQCLFRWRYHVRRLDLVQEIHLRQQALSDLRTGRGRCSSPTRPNEAGTPVLTEDRRTEGGATTHSNAWEGVVKQFRAYTVGDSKLR